ncbi:hypothetical protein EX30DRAFT_375333 [Ascodesmis nigricans]|uniref:Uncharacterized protein n=1 Tax=Ascodesmis nigricans TaxID=341454 RepID=A0A4V3SHK9_9PEZI|nr:hypothetical protein EX30DRAFT_375333 [Ascodesmis nigricans]
MMSAGFRPRTHTIPPGINSPDAPLSSESPDSPYHTLLQQYSFLPAPSSGLHSQHPIQVLHRRLILLPSTSTLRAQIAEKLIAILKRRLEAWNAALKVAEARGVSLPMDYRELDEKEERFRIKWADWFDKWVIRDEGIERLMKMGTEQEGAEIRRVLPKGRGEKVDKRWRVVELAVVRAFYGTGVRPLREGWWGMIRRELGWGPGK